MEKWIVLAEFFDEEVLLRTETLLEDHKIKFRVRNPETHLNSALGQQTSQPFVIEVEEKNLQDALTYFYKSGFADEDIPIEEYSSDELREIVMNPDEWHTAYVLKAREELAKRGEKISEEKVTEIMEAKIEKARIGQKPNMVIYCACWVFAVLGGLLGIIGGFFYWRTKTKAFDGQKYFMYTPQIRNGGLYMFITGILSVILQLAFLLLSK